MYKNQGNKKRKKYKAARPKREKWELQVILSPRIKIDMSVAACFGTHQANLIFEAPFPLIDFYLTIIENNSISCGLDGPTGSDDYLSEYGVPKIFSSLQEHVQST